MKRIVIGAIVGALVLAGCSTRTETVTVETDPPGATIEIGDTQITSPGSATLATDREYHVVATHPGCPVGQTEIRQRMDWGSFRLLMLVFPVGIPLGSMHGTMYTLEPTDIHLNLCPPGTIAAAARRAAASTPARPGAAPTPSGEWKELAPEKRR
jgi:hypothetical protein